MHLDEIAINEFKKLYLREYGIELTDNQAVEHGMRLIRLVKAVYGEHLPSINRLTDKGIDNDHQQLNN